MKKYILILLLLFSCGKDLDSVKKFVIVETSDVHGTIFNQDFISGSYKAQGYISVKYVLDSLRNVYGEDNILYIDVGDLLQGTPLVDYYNHKNRINPMVEILNDLKLDAFIIGNHDIEQGREVWEKARKDSHFPWICANILDENDSSHIFIPYYMFKKGDLKILLFGLITPGIPIWLDKSIYKGMIFSDMVNTTENFIDKELSKKDGYDILIGAFHSGITPQKGSPFYPENIPEENASEIIRTKFRKYFDVILTGHEHKIIPDTLQEYNADEIPLVMPGKNANYVSVVEIYYRKKDNGIKILKKIAKNIRVPLINDSISLAKKYLPLKDTIFNYINENICKISYDLSSENSRLEDTPLIDLINKVQLDKSGAQISITSSFSTNINIKEGFIKRKDLFALYPYENTLYVLKMKGNDIYKHILEMSKYYYREGDSLKINKDIPGYNFDILEGLKYHIIYEKNGKTKVMIDGLINGKQFYIDSIYTVAVNSYRAQQLMRLYDCEVIKIIYEPIRKLIEEYLLNSSEINIKENNNWRIVIE